MFCTFIMFVLRTGGDGWVYAQLSLLSKNSYCIIPGNSGGRTVKR